MGQGPIPANDTCEEHKQQNRWHVYVGLGSLNSSGSSAEGSLCSNRDWSAFQWKSLQWKSCVYSQRQPLVFQAGA